MAYRIVAKSPDHLNDIVEDIMSWFETARDYRVEFDNESRKFADPATKQIVTKKIDVLHVQDTMTGKKTVIKFIPLLRPEEMKIEMGGENEHVMKGKLKNMMKGRGEFKTYNKDTLRKMENQMKISEFKKIVREEVQAVVSMNEAATMTLPKEFEMYRVSGMTPDEGGYGEYNYGVTYFHSDRERLNITDVAKNANAAFKMAKQVAQAIQGDRAEGMASLGGDDVKNVKIHAMKSDNGESGIGFTAYVYSKMSPKDVKKAIKGPGVKGVS